MNAMLPMVFLLSERNDRRRDVADALLPAIAPVPAASRVALTAIVADSAVRRQETRTNQVAEEAITAATSPSLTAANLDQFDRLKPVLERRPDLRDRLLEQAAVGETVVKLVEAARNKGTFDLGSEEAKPLRELLSSSQWNQIATAMNGGSASGGGSTSGSGGEASGTSGSSGETAGTSSSGGQAAETAAPSGKGKTPAP
jgi:uncharacterized membrane protein YgcG